MKQLQSTRLKPAFVLCPKQMNLTTLYSMEEMGESKLPI